MAVTAALRVKSAARVTCARIPKPATSTVVVQREVLVWIAALLAKHVPVALALDVLQAKRNVGKTVSTPRQTRTIADPAATFAQAAKLV